MAVDLRDCWLHVYVNTSRLVHSKYLLKVMILSLRKLLKLSADCRGMRVSSQVSVSGHLARR